MEKVKDIMKKDLEILFVGFNPSIRSSETGHHFANPNNRFWKILFEAGITPVQFAAEEDHKLLDYNLGITNIVARPTKSADEISKEEYLEGKEILFRKITKYGPKMVCYVGKGVYQEFCKKRKISWGIQLESVVPGIIDFVAPSSSGLVRMKLVDMVKIYHELGILMKK